MPIIMKVLSHFQAIEYRPLRQNLPIYNPFQAKPSYTRYTYVIGGRTITTL